MVAANSRDLLLLHEAGEDRCCFPKGHVEEGETLLGAALREVAEETGLYRARIAREIGAVSYRFYSRKKEVNVLKTTVYFLDFTPDRAVQLESPFDACRWVLPEVASSLVAYSTDREIIERTEAALAEATAERAKGKPSEAD